MGDRGVIKQVDATRVGAGILEIENLTRRQGPPGKSVGINYTIVYAKITDITNAADGFYSAAQVLIDDARTTWETFDQGRTWDNTGDGLEELFEMNFSDTLEVDDIVQVMATNIAGVGGKPKWAIVSAGLAGAAAECETEIIYGVSQSTFNASTPTVAVKFEDLSRFSVTKCANTPCPGDEPEMTLTVSNLGATETVVWCGETWNLPVDNGIEKVVCPTNYVDSLGDAGIFTEHLWDFDGDLRMFRFKSIDDVGPFYGTEWYNQIQIVPLIGASSLGYKSYFVYSKYPTAPYTGTFYSKQAPFGPAGYPAYAQGASTANLAMPDNWFFSWTISSVTFTHARTQASQWPS